ncbi:hypothetical protein KIPB_000374 [Kipferlia bialata]|uniref:Uncharacterized protein n=1 Tax=Kipferlia bialata TaxID=797122 RepID=A0A9K3GEM4_9EUKA|nr:hypothetical protein KIPB_000374 [Kipferlia bialata]|eukprot:g374.t1
MAGQDTSDRGCVPMGEIDTEGEGWAQADTDRGEGTDTPEGYGDMTPEELIEALAVSEKRNRTLRNQRRAAERERDETEEEAMASRARHKRQMKALQKQLDEAPLTCGDAEREGKSIAQIESLQKALQDMESERDVALREVVSMSGRIDTLTQEKAGWKAERRDLSKAYAALEELLEKTKGERDAMVGEGAELVKECDTMREGWTNMRDEWYKMRDERQGLLSNITALKVQIGSLQGSASVKGVIQQQNTIQTLSQERDALADSLKRLKCTQAAHVSNTNELEGKLTAMQAERDTLYAGRSRMVLKLSIVTGERDAAIQKVQQLQAEQELFAPSPSTKRTRRGRRAGQKGEREEDLVKVEVEATPLSDETASQDALASRRRVYERRRFKMPSSEDDTSDTSGEKAKERDDCDLKREPTPVLPDPTKLDPTVELSAKERAPPRPFPRGKCCKGNCLKNFPAKMGKDLMMRLSYTEAYFTPDPQVKLALRSDFFVTHVYDQEQDEFRVPLCRTSVSRVCGASCKELLDYADTDLSKCPPGTRHAGEDVPVVYGRWGSRNLRLNRRGHQFALNGSRGWIVKQLYIHTETGVLTLPKRQVAWATRASPNLVAEVEADALDKLRTRGQVFTESDDESSDDGEANLLALDDTVAGEGERGGEALQEQATPVAVSVSQPVPTHEDTRHRESVRERESERESTTQTEQDVRQRQQWGALLQGNRRRSPRISSTGSTPVLMDRHLSQAPGPTATRGQVSTPRTPRPGSKRTGSTTTTDMANYPSPKRRPWQMQ